MNQCAMQQNAFSACEEMWADRKTPLFCPKPRRVGQLAGPDPGGEMASSPPAFFCGSPPARAANPVVHDVRFGQDKPVLVLTGSPGNPCPPISPRISCVPRAKFGFKPAQVRVEGFDCRDRDRRRHNQSVPAMA